jgi:hypothetical protein
VTRFIQYCSTYFKDPILEVLPRTQEQARAAVTPLQVATYFHKIGKLLQDKPRAVRLSPARPRHAHWHVTLQLILCDETGWAGFLGADFKGMKCLTQQQSRREVRRLVSAIREHVTMVPVVVIIRDLDGELEAIHHVPPLWVFPRKYTSTKSAESALDPANQRPDLNRLTFARAKQNQFPRSPPGIPTPQEFPRYVAASESGNVNSVMMLNFWGSVVIPFLRKLGVTSEDTVITNWDRHSSHESQALLELQQRENVSPAFFPAHATNWFQFHDADTGPFQVLKTECRKDIDAWTIHLNRREQALCLEDFPFVARRPYLYSIKDAVSKRSLETIGLIPFNPDAVLSKMPGSTKLYAEYKFEDEEGEEVKDGAADGGGGQSDPQVQEDLFFQTASHERKVLQAQGLLSSG